LLGALIRAGRRLRSDRPRSAAGTNHAPAVRILLAAAVWILLRGHNAPGGGFIGGLVAVAGTAAYAMVFGRWRRSGGYVRTDAAGRCDGPPL